MVRDGRPYRQVGIVTGRTVFSKIDSFLARRDRDESRGSKRTPEGRLNQG